MTSLRLLGWRGGLENWGGMTRLPFPQLGLPWPMSSVILTGNALTEPALALNSNLAGAWLLAGWVKVWLGEPEEALEPHAMRLSPHDPQSHSMHTATAAAHFFAGRYAEALSWGEMAIQEQPNFILSTSCAAAAELYRRTFKEGAVRKNPKYRRGRCRRLRGTGFGGTYRSGGFDGNPLQVALG